MYGDGMNFRRIARTLGVAHRSVINWVNAHAAQLPDQPPMPAEVLAVNELDELFTLVGDKKTKSMW
jgi:transposase-like protein